MASDHRNMSKCSTERRYRPFEPELHTHKFEVFSDGCWGYGEVRIGMRNNALNVVRPMFQSQRLN